MRVPYAAPPKEPYSGPISNTGPDFVTYLVGFALFALTCWLVYDAFRGSRERKQERLLKRKKKSL